MTNGEGNHGEDVKELYYYLDATPSHSYLKTLYKYPQREFPYKLLVEENRRRDKTAPEFEIVEPFSDFDETFALRIREAEEFYNQLQAGVACRDAGLVQRQALAGMIWSRQYYEYDVSRWPDGDPAQPAPPAQRQAGRNVEWVHLKNQCCCIVLLPLARYPARHERFSTLALGAVETLTSHARTVD